MALSSPVTLLANTSYFLVSQETSGGDQWQDQGTTLTTTTAASCDGPAFSGNCSGPYTFIGGAPNKTFGPLDVQYVSSQPPPPSAPEIAVQIGPNNIVDGQATAIDFGSVVQGQTGPSLTFTVRNDGNQNLTLGTVNLPAGYTLTEGLSASLAPGASDTFTVRLDSATPGAKTGDISFTNNDSNENPFNFPITGTVTPATPPEVTVLLGLNNIVDGQATPIDFGSVVQGQSGPSLVFTVRNDGGQTLTLGAPSLPAGYSLTEGLSASLAPGASDSFTVRLDSATTGTKTGQISFTNNDSDENPFNFPITGTVVAATPPEVTVLLGLDNIVDGQATAIDFGNVVQGQSGPSLAFTVRNDGGQNLTLGAVNLPGGYTLTEALSTSLAPGASDTFTVRLDSASLGTKSGQLRFSNNDSDENPFNFNITGMVTPPPPAEVTVELGPDNISDRQPTPIDFGSVVQGQTGPSRTFTVRNDGGQTMTLGAVTLPVSYTLTEPLSTSLAPGASDTFTVRLETTFLGTRSGDITFTNNDSNENPFSFPVTGMVTPPPPSEVTVLLGPNNITDGQATPIDFGSVGQGQTGPSLTFTVRNDGSQTLALGTVNLPAGYTLTEALSASLAPGASDTFTVRLDSATLGTKSGEISFANNDADEDPFNFPITGMVNATASETAFVLTKSSTFVRNDFNGCVGMRITVKGANLRVTALGRIFISGNSGTHLLKLVRASDGTDVPGGSVSISMAGGTAGQFKYAALASPVTLSANTSYYLVSQETFTGDRWQDQGTVLTTTMAASCDGPVFSGNCSSGWTFIANANRTFGPLDLLYETAP
jgi:P pilus assembly chaperone PapD